MKRKREVALSHGINANIVYGWREPAEREAPAIARSEFVPVAVAPMAQAKTDERIVEIELRRGAVTIKVLWPMGAAAELAAFTRELLR